METDKEKANDNQNVLNIIIIPKIINFLYFIAKRPRATKRRKFPKFNKCGKCQFYQ